MVEYLMFLFALYKSVVTAIRTHRLHGPVYALHGQLETEAPLTTSKTKEPLLQVISVEQFVASIQCYSEMSSISYTSGAMAEFAATTTPHMIRRC